MESSFDGAGCFGKVCAEIASAVLHGGDIAVTAPGFSCLPAIQPLRRANSRTGPPASVGEGKVA